ncbi:hypothetical protein L1987_57159 [Smallanthus sonchifolius]|uniref:Uncharacterized protein n=2 Tax=Smallanthus sonchifolius TaxID=185202 RepID=A0ACB9DC99_9ASTR|nr:hypothetical protein L1987_57156 [Smallanthus sonchifolius]KAI3744085.1 hypothetical protein L1987_57159 [Smallanthus sonchifolius]
MYYPSTFHILTFSSTFHILKPKSTLTSPPIGVCGRRSRICNPNQLFARSMPQPIIFKVLISADTVSITLFDGFLGEVEILVKGYGYLLPRIHLLKVILWGQKHAL